MSLKIASWSLISKCLASFGKPHNEKADEAIIDLNFNFAVINADIDAARRNMSFALREMVTVNSQSDGTTKADENLFEQLFNESHSYSVILDSVGRISYANETFAKWLETTPDSLCGFSFLSAIQITGNRIFTDDFARVSKDVYSVFRGAAESIHSECRLISNEGLIWISFELTRKYDSDHELYFYTFNATDITKLKEAQEELEFLKKYDSITGFPMLEELFAEIKRIAKLHAESNHPDFSLINVMLDDFDIAEASLGKNCKDRLLRNVSIRLSNLSTPIQFFSNIDRHSFGLIVNGNVEVAKEVVREIMNGFKRPFFIGNESIMVTASYGVVHVKGKVCKPERLLRCSREAMERSKDQGLEFYATVYESDDNDRENTFMIISDLKQAIETNGLSLRYQPIVDLSNRKMMAVEALLRWKHPKLGMIPPSRFIPISEGARIMPKIERWLIDETFKQLSEWHSLSEEHKNFRLSINVSPLRFGTESLIDELTDALRKYSLDPKDIILEITESQTIERFRNTYKMLGDLDRMGFEIALDDFGTGYSSLNYLTTLPISVVKIDKSFVSRVADSNTCSRILDAIVELSNTLGLRVVAEGIEIDSQMDYLKSIGCGYGQGFLLKAPTSGEEITEILRTNGGYLGYKAIEQDASVLN